MTICVAPTVPLCSTDIVVLRSLVCFEISNRKVRSNLKVLLDNQPK